MSVKGTITTADYLDFNEYKRLIKCLEEEGKYKDCLYAMLSFCLGLRISDVLKLRWEEIIGCRFIIVTEKKTKKTKRIPISLETARHIEQIYRKLGKPDLNELVFVGRNEKPLTRQGVNLKLKKWKLKYDLNISNFSSHTFRKTFGRYVYETMGRSNEALVLLNRIFRHSSISTTMIYIGLRDDEISDIFNNLAI